MLIFILLSFLIPPSDASFICLTDLNQAPSLIDQVRDRLLALDDEIHRIYPEVPIGLGLNRTSKTLSLLWSFEQPEIWFSNPEVGQSIRDSILHFVTRPDHRDGIDPSRLVTLLMSVAMQELSISHPWLNTERLVPALPTAVQNLWRQLPGASITWNDLQRGAVPSAGWQKLGELSDESKELFAVTDLVIRLKMGPITPFAARAHQFLSEALTLVTPQTGGALAQNTYLEKIGRYLYLPVETVSEKSFVRLALLAGAGVYGFSLDLALSTRYLPDGWLPLLLQELSRTGVDDGWALYLQQAPQLIDAAIAWYQKHPGYDYYEKSACRLGLTLLARIFAEARERLSDRPGGGMFSLGSPELIEEMSLAPLAMAQKEFKYDLGPTYGQVEIHDGIFIQRATTTEKFPKVLSGREVILIALDGEHDTLPAAALARIFSMNRVFTKGLISLRSEDTVPYSSSGIEIAPTTVEEGGGQPERLAAHLVTTLQMTTGQDDAFKNRLLSTIQDLVSPRAPLAIVIVDAGGRTLSTTPSDLSVMEAISQSLPSSFDVKFYTAIVAADVEASREASTILRKSRAGLFVPDEKESRILLGVFGAWKIDGSTADRFSRMSLAWKEALRGMLGYVSLPTPQNTGPNQNPNPFVKMGSASAGVLWMDTDEYLRVNGIH